MLRTCIVRRSEEFGPIHSRQRDQFARGRESSVADQNAGAWLVQHFKSFAATCAGKSMKTKRYRRSNFSMRPERGVVPRLCPFAKGLKGRQQVETLGHDAAIRVRGIACRLVRAFPTLLGAHGRRCAELNAASPLSWSMSTSITQRCALLAKSPRGIDAIVVAPTPPRTPSTKMSFPSRECRLV